jgi:hypothetical protein
MRKGGRTNEKTIGCVAIQDGKGGILSRQPIEHVLAETRFRGAAKAWHAGKAAVTYTQSPERPADFCASFIVCFTVEKNNELHSCRGG